MTQDLSKAALIKAVKKARKNLVAYRRILLATGEDEVMPAGFHFQWSDILLKDTESFALEGFRESAKTQYAIRSFPLYSLTFPSRKRDYIVIIKNNETLAQNKLKELESEYVSNPAISANCVKIREQSGKVFSVDVENDKGEVINVRIEAYGKGASIRGLTAQDRRPKIAIIDDPQDVEDAKSEAVQETDWNWFLSDVKFLGQHTRIFLIANNLGEKCIIERVFQNAEALKFRTMRLPTMIGENSAWPEKYKIEDIEKEKESYRKMGKIDVWMREKMCVATSEETREFNPNDFRYYVPHIIKKIASEANVYITVDPAYSLEKTSSLRAIVVNAVDADNKWFIADVKYGRWSSTEFIDILFQTVREWKEYIKEVGIEKGLFKSVMEPFIYKEMSMRNVFFNIVPIEHAKKGSKFERIRMLGPRFKAHQIWFPEWADWLTEMVVELAGVTKDGLKSLFNDLIDTLAMQEQIAQAPVNQERMQNLPREAVMTSPINAPNQQGFGNLPHNDAIVTRT